MEILFKSPRRPERLLHTDEALTDNHSETLSVLLSPICDIIFAPSFLPKDLFSSSLNALQLQDDLFRTTLTNIKFVNTVGSREEKVIQAALDGLYEEDDIEGAFYKYGGYEGIIALVLFFKESQNIQRQWAIIAKEFRRWFVKRAVEMLSDEVIKWIPQFFRTREPCNPNPLQYLGTHAGRKRKRKTEDKLRATPGAPPPPPSNSRDTSHTASQQCQEPQTRHQGERAGVCTLQDHQNVPSRLTPANTPSPDQDLPQRHRQPSNSSSDRYTASTPLQWDQQSGLPQNIPTPISKVSSPKQDRPPEPSRPCTAFDKLDEDCRDLATLMVLLGGADIPKKMLLRAAKPKGFFSQAGQIDSASPPDLNPLFAHSQNLDSALKRMESLTLICLHKFGGHEFIRIQPKLRSFVESTLGDARRDMEYKASLLVFHSFPEDPDADRADRADRADCADCADGANCVNGFEELCSSQLPHVEHVLKYFEAPDFINQFSAPERERIVYSCLSASGFGILDRKLSVLAAAERIMGVSQADFLLSAKLRLRRLVLCYLYPTQFKDAYLYNIELDLSPTNASSNVFLADYTLFCVQVMIYRDELSSAWHELRNMKPLDANRPEERRVLQKKICFQIKICLFAGEFIHAKRLLEELNGSAVSRSVQPKYFSYLVSVNCECGTIDAAMETLPTSNFLAWPWLSLGVKGRRASLAAAGTGLMKGLWILKNSKEFGAAKKSLLEAKAIYETINQVYSKISNASLLLAIRQFSVSAGLAMIAHLEWRFPKTVTAETALSYWQAAFDVGEKSGRNLGGTPFSQMIISYTMCDITSQLGLKGETGRLLRTAKSLYQVTGRQFHYFGLGSIWFDMVQEWNTERGLDRISELTYGDYMAEQVKGGFPYEINTVRLCK